MRILSSLLGLVLLFLTVSFALSNRQEVVVSLWPLLESKEVPLFMVSLVSLLLGFFVGGFFGLVGAFLHRLEVHRLNKKVGSLSEKIGDMQKSAVIEKMKTKPKSSFWSR